MEKQKLAYIVNPVSGTVDKGAMIDYVRSTVDNALFDLTIHYTTAVGNATEMAAYYASQGYNKVIAVGGDGTVNEVAKGLLHTDAVMGILPTGSGNGLARHLKIPLNFKQAVDIINKGKVIKIDHGILNDKVFMCTAGVGFDAYIGNRFAKAGKRGFFTYAELSAIEYFRYKPQIYKITIGGKTFFRRALLITFANASQWGNNAYIAPKANLCDGILDMVVLRPFSFIDIPMISFRMFTKRLDRSRYIEIYRVKDAVVERDSEGYIHFDGEPGFMGAKLEVNIVPRSLNILVPQ